MGLNIYQHFGVDCGSHESQISAEKYIFCASMDYLNSNIFLLKEYFSVQEDKGVVGSSPFFIYLNEVLCVVVKTWVYKYRGLFWTSFLTQYTSEILIDVYQVPVSADRAHCYTGSILTFT